MTATERITLMAMQDRQAMGGASEADLINAGIAALTKTGMSEETARSVATIVHGAHFKVWSPV